MKLAQKIKKILFLLIIILTCGIVSIFHFVLNPNIEKIFFDKLNIVSSEDKLLVHFISVGQGDAVAINLPNGKVMLIDTGPKTKNVTYTNYLDECVLNSSYDKTIDYVILTHADIDHIGGTLRLLKNYKINKLFMPKIASNSLYYKDLENFIDGRYEYDFLDDDDVLDVGDCELKVLSGYEYSTTNQSSAVVKLRYLDRSFIFTGDIDMRVERDLIGIYGDELDSDVLKVAHHGSNYSTSFEFLQYVSPEYSVVSVGDNYYGHPHDELIDRLEDSDSEIYRTDTDGSIVFVVDENFDLTVMSGPYVVIGMNLDIRHFAFAVVMICSAVVIVIMLPKKRYKK